jgi:putative ABC transport system permease protein
MSLFHLAIRNAFRHRLRTLLTVLGLAMATMAYGLINTVIEAWYASADASSNTRLITRSAISFNHPLPLTHAQQMRGVPGVSSLTWLTWFGGIHGNNRQPFTKLAVDADSYFGLYPEYVLSDSQRQAFQHDRQGAVIGPKLASTLGLKIGDTLPIRGDKYPGNWAFTIRGIYQPRDSKADDALMFVQWSLLSETLRARLGSNMPDMVGIYVIGLSDPVLVPAVSSRIDALFQNSAVSTKTQSERSYQLSIVAMSRNVLIWLRIVSMGLILISLMVLTNVITMSAAERSREYATLKALGFSPAQVALLLLTESMAIACMAVLTGIALTYPASAVFVSSVGSLVNGFEVSPGTLGVQASIAVVVGLLAGMVPAWQMSRINVAQVLGSVRA